MDLVTAISIHLAKQRSRSVSDIGCAYRGHNGKMCAVGCVIPDELYSPAMEGHGLASLPGRHPEVMDYLMKEFFGEWTKQKEITLIGILDVAQDFHDQGRYIAVLKAHEHLSDEELAKAIEQDIRDELEAEEVAF